MLAIPNGTSVSASAFRNLEHDSCIHRHHKLRDLAVNWRFQQFLFDFSRGEGGGELESRPSTPNRGGAISAELSTDVGGSVTCSATRYFLDTTTTFLTAMLIGLNNSPKETKQLGRLCIDRNTLCLWTNEY